MSLENVEVVTRAIEAWNRRDLRTWLATFRSDAEIDWSRARGPLKGVYRGSGEVEALWNQWFFTLGRPELRRTASLTRALKSWSRIRATFGGAKALK
jgi:ketosteroid isomerase-like protein